jgi:predicted porin
LEMGFSGMRNTDYVSGGAGDAITLWALDFNYHKGNFDVRLEYGQMFQETDSFGFANNIIRQGFNGQIAYRARDLPNSILQKLEFVYRYGYVTFGGIDPTTLDLTTYSTPVDVPVRRQQNEFGISYWFTPRLVVKVAYQINDEPGFHLHDNQVVTELAWGW